MKPFGLSELLAPVSPTEFFASIWPEAPLFVGAKAGKLKTLLELNQLQDVEALVAARSLKVRACLPDYEDEYSSILVDPTEALKLYRNNMTLVFDSMQTQSPLIASILSTLRLELGLPTHHQGADLSQGRSISYATPAGGRTRLHFDANANFVIQIKGVKRWGLAANRSVTCPTERYTTGTGELDLALERQCRAPLLDRLPEDSLEIVMEPGCVLFVPRGYWHETTTDEDSLSLNFTFSQPTWADIFTRTLHSHLLKSVEWRSLADGLGSLEPKKKAAAIEKFETLIKTFAKSIPQINAQALLEDL